MLLYRVTGAIVGGIGVLGGLWMCLNASAVARRLDERRHDRGLDWMRRPPASATGAFSAGLGAIVVGFAVFLACV